MNEGSPELSVFADDGDDDDSLDLALSDNGRDDKGLLELSVSADDGDDNDSLELSVSV